jgi:hypothetical protein
MKGASMFDQLIKQSQELIVIDPSSDHSEGHSGEYSL